MEKEIKQIKDEKDKLEAEKAIMIQDKKDK